MSLRFSFNVASFYDAERVDSQISKEYIQADISDIYNNVGYL